MDMWIILTVASKVLIYISTAGIIGGLFCLWLLKAHAMDRAIQRYMLAAGILGLAATTASFAVHTGAAIGEGFAGAFDRDIAAIIWQTGVGDSTRTRMPGFAIALAGILLSGRIPGYLRYALVSAGAALLLFAFTQTGHLHDDNRGKVLLAIHLFGICLWLGSLYPLWRISGGCGVDQLQTSMRRFGQTAVAFVAMLVICGVLMILILVQPLSGLVTSPYGQLLLIKLCLVSLLLAFAAVNKLYLVPRLRQPGYSSRLRASIGAEMVTGFGILIATGYLTTATGPM